MKKVILIAVTLLSVVVLGCSSLRETANTTSGVSNTSNSNAGKQSTTDSVPATGKFAPSGDAKADIDKLAERFFAQKSFKAKMVGETQNQTQMLTDLEFVTPDRYRLKNSNVMEMIVISNTTYMNLGGSWRKMNLPVDSTIDDMRNAFSKDGTKWFSDVKYTGDETVNGRPAYVYAYHNKGQSAGVGENDSQIWVAKDDGMPVKVDMIYRSGKLKKMTIEYDYKTPVSIEPPIK